MRSKRWVGAGENRKPSTEFGHFSNCARKLLGVRQEHRTAWTRKQNHYVCFAGDEKLERGNSSGVNTCAPQLSYPQPLRTFETGSCQCIKAGLEFSL